MNDATRTLAALLQASTDASSRVLVTVLTDGPISRVDIARQLGLSQAAVTKAVNPLISLGLIDASDTTRLGGPGRPAQPVAVVADAMIVLGVKVTADELIAVATDLTTRVLDVVRAPLDENSPSGAIEGIVAVAGKIAVHLGPAMSARIAAVGVTVSGDVDPVAGVVRESALMGWKAMPLGRLLEERIGRPVSVHNDVHALTIAEHWFGVGRGTTSFAIVTIGRGIGAGIHLNAEVVEGAFGVVGELGHLPLTSPEHVCACGRRGCVEAVAASDAIARAVSADVGRAVRISEAVELARGGDLRAQAIFAKAGEVIGRAVASLVNLVGPEVVVLSGEGVDRLDVFEPHLRNAYDEHVFASAVNCRIEVRQHSFDDWARGAATVAIRDLVIPASANPHSSARPSPVTADKPSGPDITIRRSDPTSVATHGQTYLSDV